MARTGNANLAKRREQILAVTRRRDFVSVEELSERFDVSTVTVRSDLEWLSDLGYIRRVHGGAVPRNSPYAETPYEVRQSAEAGQKLAIAVAAVNMVTSNDSILLDVGTTTMAIALELVRRSDLENLTVFTNGLNIALALEVAIPRINVVVTGGSLRPLQHSLVDPMAGLVFDQIRAGIAFIGCNGIHPLSGITSTNLPEREMKRKLIAAAHQIVIVADDSKFSQEAMSCVCDIEAVDLILTSGSPPVETVEAIGAKGATVEIVASDETLVLHELSTQSRSQLCNASQSTPL